MAVAVRLPPAARCARPPAVLTPRTQMPSIPAFRYACGRTPDQPPGRCRNPARPQPGLGDLPALAARVRRAGTPIQLLVTGTIRPLADGIELSAYRIIQEALTNTMKHGGPGAAAVVAVHYAGTELAVEVTDDGGRAVPAGPAGPATPDGPSPRDSGPGDRPRGRGLAGAEGAGSASRDHGHGLVGMAARVAMLGGELQAGPGNSAGFRVRARLPVPGSPGRPASPGAEYCAGDSVAAAAVDVAAAPVETVE
jgi:hypothetical protein